MREIGQTGVDYPFFDPRDELYMLRQKQERVEEEITALLSRRQELKELPFSQKMASLGERAHIYSKLAQLNDRRQEYIRRAQSFNGPYVADPRDFDDPIDE